MQSGLLMTNAAIIAVLAFQGLLIVAILKRLDEVRTLIRTVDVPAVGGFLQRGSPAPPFHTEFAGSSAPFSLESLRERGGVLVFVSATCDACEQLLKQLAIGDVIEAGVCLILLGDSLDLAPLLGSTCDFVTRGAGGIASACQISQFPTAVAIDRAGRIAGYNHPHDRRDVQRLLHLVVDEASGADDASDQGVLRERRLSGANA